MCGSTSGHQRHVRKEIELHAQYLLTIIGTIVNIIGALIWSFNTRIFPLITIKVFIQAPKIIKENGNGLDMDVLILH